MFYSLIRTLTELFPLAVALGCIGGAALLIGHAVPTSIAYVGLILAGLAGYLAARVFFPLK